MSIRSQIDNFQCHRRNYKVKHHCKSIVKSLYVPPLTREQRNLVKKCWDVIGVRYEFSFHALVNHLTGGSFNPFYVPEELFYPYILRSLNPVRFCGAYEYKGNYPRLFKEFKQPELLVNMIGNHAYNGMGERIKNDSEFHSILAGKSFIIKPSSDSNCGKGIKAINHAKEDEIKQIFEDYKTDFVIQGICAQSQKTKVFNPTSLNTFRVTTLLLNGKFSILNIVFRCGKHDAVVDNHGAGGLMCGCSLDGKLMPYAYDTSFSKKYYQSSTNHPFGGQINEVKKIISIIETYAEMVLPNIGIVGWDFALDSNNDPILIEVNLGGFINTWPGIFAEQICTESSLFGDRTQEVISWVTEHRPLFRDLLMS